MRIISLRQRRVALIGILASACLLQGLGRPLAATATSNLTVQITINSTCTVASPTALDFGPNGILSANVDAQQNITVTCTNTTPYNVGLNAGTGAGATVTTRKMTSGGATINYTLYQDSGRTTIWGNTVNTDTVAGTGTGSAQTLTIYGRVPPQSTPAAGTYTDTVTVTVTY